MTALVRRPSPRLERGLVTHVARRPVDAALALRQWRRYTECLGGAGWTLAELPPADESPDGVFVEDTMALFGDLAVIGRPAPRSRRGEVDSAVLAIAGLGYRIEPIRAPGTLDGGDVLRVGDAVYVGAGGRTTNAAIDQLRSLLEPLGAKVTPVPLAGVLHLKSALGALPDGSIVGYLPHLAAPHLLPRLREVPEPAGAQVVSLDQRRLLLSSDCPQSAELFASLGYEPVTVDIGEFQKLEGAVTCLSVLADQGFR